MGTVVLDSPLQIELFHMSAQLRACKLHRVGLKHSSGRSIVAHVKRTYGLHGNTDSVIAQFEEMVQAKYRELVASQGQVRCAQCGHPAYTSPCGPCSASRMVYLLP